MSEDFARLTFDSISARPSQHTQHIDSLSLLDTDQHGKTYVMGLIDIQLPNHPIRDQLKVKMDIGAESNILPLRTYANLFPERMTEDGLPNPEYLENTHVEFECNKSSIVKSLGCTTLEIALPDKELIRSQFFISTEHDRILLGHPACDKLRA